MYLTKSKLCILDDMHESNAYRALVGCGEKVLLGGSTAATSSHFPSQPHAATKTMRQGKKWASREAQLIEKRSSA